MGLTKEQKAERSLQNAGTLLAWYTAWLMASHIKLYEGVNINEIVNKFMEEDGDMARRFLRLPQKEE